IAPEARFAPGNKTQVSICWAAIYRLTANIKKRPEPVTPLARHVGPRPRTRLRLILDRPFKFRIVKKRKVPKAVSTDAKLACFLDVMKNRLSTFRKHLPTKGCTDPIHPLAQRRIGYSVGYFSMARQEALTVEIGAYVVAFDPGDRLNARAVDPHACVYAFVLG